LWSIDIVGNLTPAQGNYTFVIVVVELNTSQNGVEVKPLTNIRSTSIRKFFWQNIIYHYSVPKHITVDNAKYFDNAMFKDFCQRIGTKVAFASVYHPQTNGAVEKANGPIFKAIKEILQSKKKGKWAEVMLHAVGVTKLQCVEQQILRRSG
jgi:IS30 family transposase